LFWACVPGGISLTIFILSAFSTTTANNYAAEITVIENGTQVEVKTEKGQVLRLLIS